MPALIEPTALSRELENPRLLVVCVTSAASYTSGHVPGAVLVTPAELVSGTAPATGTLPPPERLTTLFDRIGYRADLDIVAYDDEGGGWAGRFLWTLDVIGHREWRYLDGGIHAWRAADLPLETRSVARAPTTSRLVIDRAPQADASELLQRLDDEDLLIWDCRSREEYLGLKSGARRAGHIPGAVNLDWLDLMDRSRALRLRTDLEAVLARAGIDARRDVVTHCQTHHRSGLSYLVARLLGFPRIRAYAGSWSDWGNRDDTPVATGA